MSALARNRTTEDPTDMSTLKHSKSLIIFVIYERVNFTLDGKLTRSAAHFTGYAAI